MVDLTPERRAALISFVEDSGAMPEDFYTAQDRSYANSNLTLSWNILDVGLMGYKKGMSEIDGLVAPDSRTVYQLNQALRELAMRAAADRVKRLDRPTSAAKRRHDLRLISVHLRRTTHPG